MIEISWVVWVPVSIGSRGDAGYLLKYLGIIGTVCKTVHFSYGVDGVIGIGK